MALMEMPFFAARYFTWVQEFGVSFSSVLSRMHFNGILLNMLISL